MKACERKSFNLGSLTRSKNARAKSFGLADVQSIYSKAMLGLDVEDVRDDKLLEYTANVIMIKVIR